MKDYEVRYYSEMIQGLALYSRHQTRAAARESAEQFLAHVRSQPMDPRSKAAILKSIQVV